MEWRGIPEQTLPGADGGNLAHSPSHKGPGDLGLALQRGRGGSSSLRARTFTTLALTNPRQRAVGLMVKYLVSEITRPDSAVS